MHQLETHKILVPTVHKIEISRKTNSFGTFWVFFHDIMDVWHYQSNYPKDLSKKRILQILICSLLQAKHLVITQEKDNGIKMVLLYCLQQNVGVELCITIKFVMLKQFPLQLGKAVTAAS